MELELQNPVVKSVYKSSFAEVEVFMQSDILAPGSLLSKIIAKVRSFLGDTRAGDVFDRYWGLIEESNILRAILISAVLSCLFPVSLFFMLCGLFLMVMFTGFLIVEGAVVVLTACVSVLWLGAMTILFIVLAVVISLIYAAFKCAGDAASVIETIYFLKNVEVVRDDDVVVRGHDHED